MEKDKSNNEQEVPDALGNDKLQGKDMAKAGHGEKVHVKEQNGEEKNDKPAANKHNEEDTIGIP